MTDLISIREFLKLAPNKLKWLVDRGFSRNTGMERVSSTVATLVYCGENVAFEFSLDVRDQCIDTEVIRVQGGQLLRNWEGGYSSEVYNHLVKVEGYRGSPTGNLVNSPKLTKLDWAIDGWISLIETAGSSLLADRAGVV